MMDRNPQATIVIVTRNRKQEVRNAVRSALMQRGRIDVMVIDDGSTDGTADTIRNEFPQVEFRRSETSQGHIVHRNFGIMQARAPIVFVLDDDATFGSEDTVLQTLKEFEHPRVAAVAIPFVELGQTMRQKAPDSARVWATDAFIGAAHAVRQSVFVKLGGYRESLRHFAEESDLCSRMLSAGYIVRLGSAPAGTHDFSTTRDSTYERYYAARNAIYFAWHNVPTEHMLQRIAVKTAGEFVNAIKYKAPLTTLRGIGAGYVACAKDWNKRQPPSAQTYQLFTKLKSRKAVPLDEIESELPAIA